MEQDETRIDIDIDSRISRQPSEFGRNLAIFVESECLYKPHKDNYYEFHGRMVQEGIGFGTKCTLGPHIGRVTGFEGSVCLVERPAVDIHH
jgi:hypothetical protein